MAVSDSLAATGLGIGAESGSSRDRLDGLIARHIWLWEGGMAVLAAIYVGLSFWTEERGARISGAYMTGLATVFVAEFAVRLWAAPDRSAYVRKHWLDAVTAIPLLGPLRALRLLRLVRLTAVFRALTVADHITGHDGKSRTSLWFLGPALVLLWVGSAYAFWVLEKGVNPTMHNFGDAMYLSFATVTTFGYGDSHPVTAAGQVLAGLLIFSGIGLVGFASSQLTARFLHTTDAGDIVRHEMGELRHELAAMRELLERTLDHTGVEAA